MMTDLSVIDLPAFETAMKRAAVEFRNALLRAVEQMALVFQQAVDQIAQAHPQLRKELSIRNEWPDVIYEDILDADVIGG